MPRPSLKDQRSAQILDAYLTCVARFGLEGATQERVAAEAGVKRPLLRHYLGNREEMLSALTAYVVESFAQTTRQLSDYLDKHGTPSDLIDVLFADDHTQDPRLMLAYQAMVTATNSYPHMREPLLQSYVDFLAMIRSVLAREYPEALPECIHAVAQGVAASTQTLDAMLPIAPPGDWRNELKHSSEILISSLETSK